MSSLLEVNTHPIPLSVSRAGSSLRIWFSKNSFAMSGSRSGSSPISYKVTNISRVGTKVTQCK